MLNEKLRKTYPDKHEQKFLEIQNKAEDYERKLEERRSKSGRIKERERKHQVVMRQPAKSIEIPCKRLAKWNASDEKVTSPGNNTRRSMMGTAGSTKSSFM